MPLLCFSGMETFPTRTFLWYTNVSICSGQCKENWKCIACDHNQNASLRGFLKMISLNDIYFILRMPRSKEKIMFLTQLSPVCQPTGTAAQAHTSSCQPSSLLLCAANIERERRGQMASAALLVRPFLGFNLRVIERQRNGSPYKWIVFGSVCAAAQRRFWQFFLRFIPQQWKTARSWNMSSQS